MSSPITPQAALIYVMVVVSASDARMSDTELHTIGDFVRSLPVFDGFSEDAIIPVARECGLILQETGGLDSVLAMVSEALPPRLRETAYAVALDVALADTPLEPEENRILQRLRKSLGIDALVAVALERSARALHQKL